MESLLPSKPVLTIPSGVPLDEASSMIDHKKESQAQKHRSNATNDESNEEDEDDDDQYVDDDDEDDDDDDEDEDGQPRVQTCQTH